MEDEAGDDAKKTWKKNKWVKVSGWENIEAARREVIEAVERFNPLPDKPNF